MEIIRNKIFWAVIIACVSTGCIRRPSDQALFRESVTAGKTAEGNVQSYIFSEIAQAQAEHGYYTDALETARLVDRYADQLFIELVTIRARSRDILGAKNMTTASMADLKLRADEAIAMVQATAGDLKGARDTCRDLSDKSSVLGAIGAYQVKSGDLEGALTTAAEMKPGWSDQVLFAVVEKLREQGDKQRAHEIAIRITDPDMARSAEGVSMKQATQPTDACELAWNDAKSGRYADAYEKLQAKNCDCRTVAHIHEEAHDADGAERAMRSCPNPADVSAGMAELAKRSAARGDISTALKFADSVHVTGASFEEGYLAPVLRDIGRAWGKKEAPSSALKWARSRSGGFQRAMALLGVAESISSSRAGS